MKIEEGVYILFFCPVKVTVPIFLSCEKSYWENRAGFSLEESLSGFIGGGFVVFLGAFVSKCCLLG